MSAAATAAGYLYASGRIGKRLRAQMQGGCGKNVYPTEGAALSNAVARTGNGAPPLRAYHCAQCRGWHLTSEARRA